MDLDLELTPKIDLTLVAMVIKTLDGSSKNV